MPLDDIQKFLKQYDELTKAGVAVVGTMSGWLYHAWQRRHEARPKFTLEAKDADIILGNHGKDSFEIIHATIVLRDVGSRPELAKKHTTSSSVWRRQFEVARTRLWARCAVLSRTLSEKFGSRTANRLKRYSSFRLLVPIWLTWTFI